MKQRRSSSLHVPVVDNLLDKDVLIANAKNVVDIRVNTNYWIVNVGFMKALKFQYNFQFAAHRYLFASQPPAVSAEN